uniref:Uncharacterized protein n=1 Tax=Acrobeloides nanus TaxID=290746 RepID=A0A914DMT7_9BILA
MPSIYHQKRKNVTTKGTPSRPNAKKAMVLRKNRSLMGIYVLRSIEMAKTQTELIRDLIEMLKEKDKEAEDSAKAKERTAAILSLACQKQMDPSR